MGFAKRMWLDQIAQGWNYTDMYVCINCVDDYALEAALRTQLDSETPCDFCRKSPAAPLDLLLEAFMEGLCNEYGDVDNEGVAYESREGGYLWDTMRTSELVSRHSDVFTNNDLIEAVENSLADKLWVEKDYLWRRRDEVLAESWKDFCEIVMHETRYVFWLQDHDVEPAGTGEVHPAQILQAIGDIVRELGLIKVIPRGSRFWRGRALVSPINEFNAKALGTVPRKLALRANRMNPAGIPMFYGSAEPDTAVEEVSALDPAADAILVQFETSQDCKVIDFVDLLPAVPSMFDPKLGRMRRQLMFLNQFAKQLSEPVLPTHEQIGYVPTQIVCEYIIRILDKGDVSGLFYRSPLTGGTNVVLNVPNERCIDTTSKNENELSLRLIAKTLRRLPSART